MVVLQWLFAMMLWVCAAMCAGLTGTFFEEAGIFRNESNRKAASMYTIKSMIMAVSAMGLAVTGMWLVKQ